jgi:hypothetical protein
MEVTEIRVRGWDRNGWRPEEDGLFNVGQDG